MLILVIFLKWTLCTKFSICDAKMLRLVVANNAQSKVYSTMQQYKSAIKTYLHTWISKSHSDDVVVCGECRLHYSIDWRLDTPSYELLNLCMVASYPGSKHAIREPGTRLLRKL